MMKIFGPYRKRSRTASMQLSINAIVILVMAMAVLGLGLGLIRGVLGGGSDKLKQAIEGVDLSETATAEKSVANADSITLKLRKDNEVAVSFYNSDYTCSGTDEVNSYDAYLNISCQVGGQLVSDDLLWAESNVLKVEAQQGEATKLGGIFKLSSGFSTGKYPCKIQVMCGYMDGDTSMYSPVKTYSAFIEVTA